MSWDDEEEEPETIRDPERLERARMAIAGTREARRRLLRWTYAGLGVLLIGVILLATLR